MTTERLVEIRARIKDAYDSTQDPRSDLTTITITAEMDEMFARAAGDLQWLMVELARLRAILATLPEPIARLRNEQWCVMCNDRLVGDDTIAQHAPDCPWLAVVKARGEAHR
jgi:PAS domain-containing protein